MGLFKRIFSGKKAQATAPCIRFGRFSDSYRSAEQEQAFDEALLLFERDEYLAAYRAFFKYLFVENEQNVTTQEKKGALHFEILQGSKKITGFANHQKVFAEAKIARAKTLHSGFMKRLLQENYALKYSRFALTPDSEICIVFDSHTADGSPYKLYSALKELATRADKHDDLLLDEYQSLEPVDHLVRRELPEAEKFVKYDFIASEIRAALREMDDHILSPDEYPSAFTYLLLHLCYKLDYLTKPEGFTMETLERIQRLAFANDHKNPVQKNRMLRHEFEQLLERPQEKFFKELYEVSTTFGIAVPVDHAKVRLIIEQELPRMRWYAEQGHERLALAVPGYIAGRCLFHYAIPPLDRELFHLFYRVSESAFFEKLGFPSLVKPDGLPNGKRIRAELQNIFKPFEKQLPALPDLKQLHFTSMPAFAASLFEMIRELGE